MSTPPTADDRIAALAARLRDLQTQLGSEYWGHDEVLALQDELRSEIGQYGAWDENKAPMHQRARKAAQHEREHAHLLWPR